MKKSMVIRPLPFLLNLVLSFGGGSLIGLIARPGEQFQALNAPPLVPPAWVFGVAWSVFYILMAVSITLILGKTHPSSSAAKLYFAQLIVNFIWPILFFSFGFLTFSFVWILLLIALVAAMICAFWRVSVPAAVLQLPYFLWLLFAAYLNLGYVVLN